jgi:hypothetical protein
VPLSLGSMPMSWSPMMDVSSPQRGEPGVYAAEGKVEDCAVDAEQVRETTPLWHLIRACICPPPRQFSGSTFNRLFLIAVPLYCCVFRNASDPVV